MRAVLSSESAAQFDEFTRYNVDDEMTRQTKNDWPNEFRSRRLTSAVEYINAQRHRYLLMQKVNEVITKFDAVISPNWMGNQSAITNLTGHPVICIPSGFSKNNLPTSISIIGKLYDEATIIEVAKFYQDATMWDKMHPEMFKK